MMQVHVLAAAHLLLLLLGPAATLALPLSSASAQWVTKDPSAAQKAPAPPRVNLTQFCRQGTQDSVFASGPGARDTLKVSVVHPVFNPHDGLVAGITYQVHVELLRPSASATLIALHSSLNSGEFRSSAKDASWPACGTSGTLVSVPPNAQHLKIAWSFSPPTPTATNITFRVLHLSKNDRNSIPLASSFMHSLVLSGCTLMALSEHGELSWGSLEGALALHPDCYFSIPKPPARRGVLLELTRLNVAGAPDDCQDGYLQVGDAGRRLCGKLEEQRSKQIYQPEPQPGGLVVRVHAAARHPLPVHFAFDFRAVDACYNLTLTDQNATFVSQVTSDLSCSVRVHVAFGYRVGLSLELRPAELNEVLEERDENIWDDVQVDDEYVNEDDESCLGLQIKISGPNNELWNQCASQIGPVVRLIGQTNQLLLSVNTISPLDVASQLHLRYFSIPRPELTEDCPGYGWVGVSDTSCVLPVLDRPLPWALASKECGKKGAQLATVNSAQIQDHLDQIIKGSPGYAEEDAFWLGSTDSSREGSFRWTDGKPLGYTNWFPGWPEFAHYNKQPSDDGLSEQDCVEMRRSFLAPSSSLAGSVAPNLKFTPSLMWNDRDCSASNYYVCEVPKAGALEAAEFKTAATPKREDTCDRNITLGRDLGLSPSAVVTSPGFPHSYPDNARCLTRVTAPRGYHVVIDFEELVLEKEPLCSYDYLEISEPDEEVPARRLCHDWSGKLKLLRHISKGSQLQLLFSSDYSHRFGGFKARVFMENDEVECLDSREINFNSSCYLFIGFPEVTWSTASQVCKGINAELASIHSSEEQTFLISSIRNSEQYTANIFYWLGGQVAAKGAHLTWTDNTPATYTAWPSVLQDGKEDKCLSVGWQASPTAGSYSGLQWQAQRCSLVGGYVCQRRIQEQTASLRTNHSVEGTSGSLHSPNFPQAYPTNIDYWVTIAGPPNSRIIIYFNQLDLEPQNECLYDFVALWNDGDAEPSNIVCGTKTQEELKKFKFVSSNNQLLVHFHSDFSNSGSGFALNWKAVPLNGCPQQTLTAKEGVLESPNYPDFLLTNLDCTITILAPAGKKVWLHFVEFYVDSEYSSLELSLGNGASFQPFQLKGLASDGTFLSEGESLQIHLRTPATENVMGSKGFKAVYWTLNHVDEEQIIRIAPNQTLQLLPLNWPEMAPEPGQIYSFAQKLIAPMGYTIRLTLNGLQVAQTGNADFCLEVQDFYSDLNGTKWYLCRYENASVPVTLTSYLNALLITQNGGDFLNATVTVDKDFGMTQKLLSPNMGTGVDSCSPDPCQNEGQCISSSNQHKSRPNICRCTGHFTGPFCALTMCDLSPCLYGTCILTPGSFKCNCQPGYRGTNCEVKHRPCLDNPCEGRGECVERPGGEGFNCRCHAWWEGSRCERRMMKIPFKPLSERMLQEPFWLGLITVMIVLVCIGLVWCAKRHFPEKLEKLLAEEADRSRNSYALSTSASASAPGGVGGLGAASPVGAPRNSLLGRLGIRKPSLLSLAPSSPKDGSAPRTFSLDDLLRRTPSPRKKRTNSTPTRKPIDKKQILQQLVTPTGAGSNISVNSATEAPRKVSLGELIQMSDKGRRTKSEEGPVPPEAETSLDIDPKLEKKVTFARLLDKVSAEMSSGSGSSSPPGQKKHLHPQGAVSQPDSGSEDVSTTFSGSDPTLPCTSRRLLPTRGTRLSRMSSADSILAMFRTTFNAKSSQPSTPSSPQDVSADESSAVPTPASSSAPDSPMSVHHSNTIEVPVISSGGNSSSLQHPPTILLEIPMIEYGKCLSPIKEVPTPIPSPAPTPLLPPRRNNSKERVDEEEAMRIEVLNPSPVTSPSSSASITLAVTSPNSLLVPSSSKIKSKPPSSLQIPAICFPDEDFVTKMAPPSSQVVIPILTVQTPSPPVVLSGSPPPQCRKGPYAKRLLRDLMADKPGSLEFPVPPPMITITNTLSEIESDMDTPGKTTKATNQSGMCFLSPFVIKGADHRTASESNLSSSGYSSMASPGPSRCGSSNPLCPSEPDEMLTPDRPREPPAPPPRKPSPLLRSPAIQQQQEAPEQVLHESNDEGFGTDHLEDFKLKLPAIVVQTAEGGSPVHLSPVSSRSESPLSDKVTGMDRFSPLFYHKSELPFTDSDGLYDCPSSEVPSSKLKSLSTKKRVRRPSSTSLASARGASTLGGLLEVPSPKDPSFSLQRCHRKSPKRRAARIAPPSSSSSSESLNSFRGSRGSSARKSKESSPKKSAPEKAEEDVNLKDDQQEDGALLNGSPPTSVTKVAKKISRLKAIGHQIRFLRRLELSLRKRAEQNSPSDSLDTEASTPVSSPTLSNAPAASILRFKARALARRQIPTRIHSRCELATFLLGNQTHQDSD